MDLLSFTYVLVMQIQSENEQAMKLEIRHDMIPVWRVVHLCTHVYQSQS
jgi:hypothetical protein